MIVKVTVEYYIEGLTCEEDLQDVYGGDIRKVWDFVSDNGGDHPLNFTDDYKVVGVEVMPNSEQDVQGSDTTDAP